MNRNLLFPDSFIGKAFLICLCFQFFMQSSFAVLKTSNGIGLWNTAATWFPSGVPAAGDDVVILNGHTVTIDINTTALLSLTVNGILVVGNSNANIILTVSGNVLISNTGSLITAGNGGNVFNVGGNMTVNNIYDARIGGATMNTIFNGTGNQAISGTGSTFDLSATQINNTGAAGNNLVTFSPNTLTASANFLTITNGVIRLSGTFSLTNTFFSAPAYTIPASGGFWLDNPNVTVTGRAGSPTADGLLRIDQGIFNVGTTAAHSMEFENLQVNGGTLNVANGIWSYSATGSYLQTGGTVRVASIGNSSIYSCFDFLGDNFTMSGGIIIMRQNGSLTDYTNYPTTYNITGGTVQVGDGFSLTGSVFFMEGVCPNVNVDNTTNTKQAWLWDNLFIRGNLTVSPGSSFLCDDPVFGLGYGAYVFGNAISNNGTISGSYTDSEFGFYGSSLQTYSGTGNFGTMANPFLGWGVSVVNPSNLSLMAPIFTGRINLLEGQVINSNQITLGSGTSALIQRGGLATANAGSLDGYPMYNGTPNLYLRYDDALSAIGSGFEIPSSTNTYQVFSNNSTGVTLNSNLTIANDFQLLNGTFNLQTHTLNIGNTITKTSGFINGVNGLLRMQGSTAQTIPATIFVNNDLLNLSIANTFATVPQVTLAGDLNLYGSLNFGNVNAKTFNTAGYLTLKSTATATASVADLTNAGANSNNRISGDVNVERYIGYVGKWNLLTAPVNTSQSAWSSWQNAGTAISGYGTRITGPNGPNVPQGIDNYSQGYSLKWWDEAAGNWTGITNTTTAPVNRNRGYFLFVRGDRSVIPPSIGAASTLRSRGPLYLGYSGSGAEPAPINYGSLAAGVNASAANPFASAISFANVYANSNTGNIKQQYYLWDPTAAGLYGVGRYQNFYYSGGSWLTTPSISDMASPYYGLSNYHEIQSGQAFFIESAGTGTVQVAFNEDDKITGSRLVTREPPLPQEMVMMSTMLHSNNTTVLDGNRVLYSNSFSNDFAVEDAHKITNTAFNFGIASNGRQLIVEGRSPILSTDTIHYNMSGLSNGNYQLSFEPVGLQQTGLIAELIDAFLNSRTAISLSDSSWYAFETNSNPASKAANRFMLVFRAPGGPVPVTFISIAAQRQTDRSVNIKWVVANETNIEHYEVERSADGRLFTGILQTNATNSGQYTKNDNSPLTADNYYRIKAIGLAGEITYSAIVIVAPDKSPALITVSPNPVKDKQLQVRFTQYEPGNYTILLSNALGQEIYRRGITVQGSSFVKTIALQSTLAGGHYRLSVYDAEGNRLHSEALMVE